MNKPKAYSYIRMSSDAQLKGDSRRRQLELSAAYCEKHDLELVEKIEDLGIPAFRGENVEFGTLGRFLELVRAGKVDKGSYLLVESLDRLSRQAVTKALAIFTSILESGIVVVTLTDGQKYTLERIDTDPGSLFTTLGVMLRAHDESRIKSERLKASWSHKREIVSARILTKKAPAWVKPKDDRTGFELVPHAANTIRKIYRWASSGDGYFVIVRRLNTSKTPTIGRSAEWNLSYVKKILTSREVLGEMQPHRVESGKRTPIGEPIRDYFPAVIAEAEFQQVQRQISRRRQGGGGRKGQSNSNLFQKLAICGLCGSPMNFINKGRPPKGGTYLVCRSAYQGGRCVAKPWEYSHFEESFFSFISELHLEELFDAEQNQQFEALEQTRALLLSEIDALEGRISKNLARWSNADSDIQDLLESEIASQNRRLEETKRRLLNAESEIADRRREKIESAHSNVLLLRSKLSQAQSPEDILQIRTAVANHLKNLIVRISIYNEPAPAPWEVGEAHAETGVVSGALRKHFYNLGLKTSHEIAEYLNTSAGALEAAKFERYFVVRFRAGAIKTVHPASKWAIESKPPKFNPR